MTEFDFTPGQRAFLTGAWLCSLACTGAVLLFDAARAVVRKVKP